MPYLGVTAITRRGKFNQKLLKPRNAQPLAVRCLPKSERLAANILLTIHRALVTSAMNYVCPYWEFAANTHHFGTVGSAQQDGAQRPANCTTLSKFYIRSSIIICAGSNGKSRNIVTMKMVVTLDRARPSAGNGKG